MTPSQPSGTYILAILAVAFYAGTVSLWISMIKVMNKRLPAVSRLPYLFHMKGSAHMLREYKTSFPRSRKPYLALAFAVAAVASGIGALILRAAQLLAR